MAPEGTNLVSTCLQSSMKSGFSKWPKALGKETGKMIYMYIVHRICLPDTLQEIEDFRRNVGVCSLQSENTLDPRANNTVYVQ